MILDTVLDAILTAFVVVSLMRLWRKIKRPLVYVVEDSESDIMLLKINAAFERYDVRYFRSLESIGFRLAINPPSAVIVDYKLAGKTNGDQLFRFCRRNHIPVLMTTAYDGEIMGVDAKFIAKKSGDKSYYLQIENFLNEVSV